VGGRSSYASLIRLRLLEEGGASYYPKLTFFHIPQ
jgi:hypothetical protein